MPDIDLDLDSRDVLIKYVTDKYGEDRVCQILNFSYLTPTVAVKDVASKILNLPYSKTSEISKRFAYSTFEECMQNNPSIYDEYSDEVYHRLFDITGKISGKVRHSSMHAGGVGIVDGDMYDYMGMQVGTDGERVIQVDKRVIEDIGIVKYDFLGVKTLRIVKNARNDAGLTKWDLDINNPKLESDKESYDLISSGNTDLVFQMESQGMKDLAQKAKPQTLEELSAVIALYRPDSMPYIGDYLRGKINADDIEYIHKDMKSILEKTYGALIYQEQILEIVRKFGGRTYGQSDLFRRAIGKKNMEDVRAEATKLRQEVVDNGYSEEIAEKLSDMLLVMGNYSFNKSHAMAYASLCLQTAYLKKHHPVEFFKASLNEVDKSQLSGYILDARANGVQITPPNINISEKGFSIHNGKILFGLQSIKGLGESVANTIIDEREKNGLFKSFNDFAKRVKPSESLIVTLVKAGAIPTKNKEDFLIKYGQSDMVIKPFNYKEVKSLPTLKVLENQWGIDTDLYNNKELRLIEYNKKKRVVDEAKHKEKNNKIFDIFANKYFKDTDLWEYETLSVFVGENPFIAIYKDVGMKEFPEIANGMSAIVVGVIAEVVKKKDRNKNQFAYIKVYTAWGIQEIVCWASQYSRFQNLIKKDAKIAVLCSKKDDQAFVHTIKSYEQWKSERLSE